MRRMKVRILPMLQTEETFVGKSITEIQVMCFWNDFRKERKGFYEYITYGINAQQGDLILFQMNNSIIASAEFVFQNPVSKEFNVDIKSIKIFKPITKEELENIIPDFKGFNNVKWEYDVRDVNMELLEQRMKVPLEINE